MALVDHSPLLTTLYGLKGAKQSGNQQQYDIYKQQFRNDLLNIQLKNRTSSLTQLQSAYDKQQKAYEDISEKTDIFNRQMEFFRNPQKYPAWQSNPYTSASMLKADPQAIKIQRNADWVKYLKEKYPQYHLAAGFAHSGAADNVQETVANNELLQSGQAHPTVQQNIASIGTGTTAEQNTAIAAHNSSQADLINANTEQANSKKAMLDLIDTWNMSDQQKSAMKAQVVGADPEMIGAIGTLSNDDLISWYLAKAGASDPVQNQKAGIEPYAPQRPTNPAPSPGDKGRAKYEEERAGMKAAGTQAGWTAEQFAEADQRLAAEYGLVPKPKAESAGGGVSPVERDFADGLINVWTSFANRGFAEGESTEYGMISALLSLNNILETNQTLEGDPKLLAQRFTAALGQSIAGQGEEGQGLNQQTLTQLAAEGGQLYNLIIKALNVSTQKGGGAITLQELGVPHERISQIAAKAGQLTGDETLTAGLRGLIANYDLYTGKNTPNPGISQGRSPQIHTFNPGDKVLYKGREHTVKSKHDGSKIVIEGRDRSTKRLMRTIVVYSYDNDLKPVAK